MFIYNIIVELFMKDGRFDFNESDPSRDLYPITCAVLNRQRMMVKLLLKVPNIDLNDHQWYDGPGDYCREATMQVYDHQ